MPNINLPTGKRIKKAETLEIIHNVTEDPDAEDWLIRHDEDMLDGLRAHRQTYCYRGEPIVATITTVDHRKTIGLDLR